LLDSSQNRIGTAVASFERYGLKSELRGNELLELTLNSKAKSEWKAHQDRAHNRAHEP
jgi:hypothetical protein